MIAAQLAPNCGIMNVFVDAGNTQKPAHQILVDNNLEKNSGGIDSQSYVGGLNIEREPIWGLP